MNKDRLITNKVNGEKYDEFTILLKKNGIGIGDFFMDCMINYIKEHKEGNDQYSITQFQDENFMATPAFYNTPTAWDKYLSKADNEELHKVKDKIISIDRLLGKYI